MALSHFIEHTSIPLRPIGAFHSVVARAVQAGFRSQITRKYRFLLH